MNEPPQLHQRAAIQRSGLRRARAEMFEALAESISSGQCDPDIATVALLDRIATDAFRSGVEAEADALQAEFADMSLRLHAAENPSDPFLQSFQRK